MTGILIDQYDIFSKIYTCTYINNSSNLYYFWKFLFSEVYQSFLLEFLGLPGKEDFFIFFLPQHLEKDQVGKV